MSKQSELSRRDFFTGMRRPSGAVRSVAHVSSACLSVQGVACRSCDDACDVGALQFRPQLGGRTQLNIDEESCTGCGVCVEICPVSALSVSVERGHDE